MQAPFLPAKLLNSVVDIDGEAHVMVTQFISAVPVRALGKPTGELAARADEITRALDMLFVPIRRGPPAMLAFWGLGTVVMDAHNDGLHHVGQITDRGSCGGRQRSPSSLAAG